MAPIKSSLARTVGKLLRVQKDSDLSLRGDDQRSKKKQFSATGGDTYTPGNGYKYHKFTFSGSLVVNAPEPVNVDILVVAGGGSGGSYYGGGGGAGGVAHAESMPIGSGTYPVNIGSGGAAGAGPPNNYFGNAGNPSYFGTPGEGIGDQPDYILAKGGGRGGKGTSDAGGSGGSGGGSGGGDPAPADGQATQPGTNPSPFVTDYGFPGGYSTPTGGYAPAGGGGASQAGVSINGNISGGGDGGDGQPFPTFAYPLVGMSPLNPRSPNNSHYAGGGAGGKYNSLEDPDRNALGGLGGGANGSGQPSPFAGANYLGGGGGGRHGGVAAGENEGGDGIVLVRYAI